MEGPAVRVPPGVGASVRGKVAEGLVGDVLLAAQHRENRRVEVRQVVEVLDLDEIPAEPPQPPTAAPEPAKEAASAPTPASTDAASAVGSPPAAARLE